MALKLFSYILSSEIVKKGAHEVCNDAKTNLKSCIAQRVRTVDTLNELAADLDKHHINVARAKVVGTLGKIAGTGVAAVAGIAAPFTGGLSLIPAALAATGIGLAVGGGVVSTGAGIAEDVLSKLNVEKAEKAVKIDKSLCERFRNSWQKLEGLVKNIKESLHAFEVTAEQIFSVIWQTFSKLEELFGNFKTAVSVLGSGAKMVSKVEGLVFAALNLANKGFSIAEKYFSVVGGSISSIVGILVIPFDLYTLIKNAIILFRDEPSQTGNKLRSQANDLQTSLNSMRKMRNSLC